MPTSRLRYRFAAFAALLLASLTGCGPTGPEPEPPPPPPPAVPAIALSRTTVAITATGGGANPAAETVVISNGGTGTLNGIALGAVQYVPSGGGWLTASVDRSTGPATLTIAASVGTLTAGTYTATIPVTATGASNSPQSVTVTLTVATAPVITASRTSVPFVALPGGSNPTAQTVDITNGGTGALTGLAVSAPTYGAGASGWLSATLSGTSAPATLSLQPTIGSLGPGSYSATVQLTSSVSGVAPVTVTVQLEITTDPRIRLGPATLTFVATAGASSPAPQQVAITNDGTGTLTPLAVGVVTYGAGASGWLTATLSGITAPATLTVTPNTSTLAPGEYTARVPVTATGASNTPQFVDVSLRVTVPEMLVNPATVAFSASRGGAAPPAVTATIVSRTTTPVAGIAIGGTQYQGGGNGWLEATLSGTTSPATIRLTATPGSLAEGTYTATVPVTATGASNSPQSVTVTLTVQAGPVITANRTTVTFAALPGAANPAAQTVNITNGGGGTLTGLVVSTPTYDPSASGWLSATLGGTTAPATLSLQPTIGSLAPGSYSATVQLSSSVVGVAPVSVTVQLNITTDPRIGVSPATLAFAATAGAASPAPQQVAITNAGTGTLTALGVGTVTYGAGAAGWLTAALSGTTAPATLTVTPSTTPLAPGDYTARIPITAAGASNTPQFVDVTMRVTARPTISISPTSLAFTAVAGGASPAARTVSVSASGGSVSDLTLGAPSYAGGATGWLTATLSGSTAPATIAVSAATGALTPGTYTATVPVQSATASNSPQQLTVTFTVTAPPVAPELLVNPSTVAFTAGSGGAAPPAVTVAIVSRTTSPVTGITIGAPQYQGSGTGWLQTTLSGTTSPATLRLTATPGALAPGNYTATVAVSGVAPNSPQVLTVTFNVVAPSAIVLSEDTVRYTSRRGEGQQPNRSLTVTSSNGTVITGLRVQAIAPPGTRWFLMQLPSDFTPLSASLRATIPPLPAGLSRTVARVSSATTGQSTDLVAEVQVTGSPSFTRVAAGLTANCGLTAAGGIWCWGGNGFGELGNRWIEGAIANSNVPPDTLPSGSGGWGSGLPVPVHGPDGVVFTDLELGDAHTCALSSSGDVYCWGRNTSGQLGDGTRTNRLRPVRVPLPGGARATKVSLGEAHTCALTQDAAVWCWGENIRGQLGDGTTEDVNPPYGILSPVRSILPSGVVPTSVAAAGDHTCALTADQTVWCWGQFGPPSVPTPTAITLPPTLRFKELTGGNLFVCGRSTLDEVWCWGVGSSGELGDGNRVASSVPVRVLLPSGSAVRSVSSGANHTCAVLTTNALWCWGRKGNGAFGDGVESNAVFDPVQVTLPGGVQFQQLASGTFHSCALTTSGAAWCGGKNFYGLIGNGERQNVINNRLPPYVWQAVVP